MTMRDRASRPIVAVLVVATLQVSTDSAGESAAATADGYDCGQPYELPYDLAQPPTEADQQDADAFAWQSFLALNAGAGGPAWESWHSTVDLIECNGEGPPEGGSCTDDDFYFPAECIESHEDYASYRVIDQVGKVDDDFLEATTRGLSHDPVIASNGSFLRYEILISPPMYDWIVSQGLQQESTLDELQANGTAVVFPCSESPQTAETSIMLKLAWMDLSDLPDGLDAADYHAQELLVYTPGYLSSSGEASCVKTPMGLVGQHLVRKTATQPAWVWATFEQKSNAPDCGGLPPAGDKNNSGPNEDCQALSANYNFASTATSPPSAGCNAPPADNAPGRCENPETKKSGYCLDLPPAELSHLCRQVGPGHYYPGATSWDGTPPNAACQPQGTVWANYQLMTTQWNDLDLDSADCTQNVVANNQYSNPDGVEPTVPVGIGNAPRPFLANTSMESYERADCLGCHSKSTVREVKTNVSTDFVYFLGVEVPAGPVPQSPVGPQDG